MLTVMHVFAWLPTVAVMHVLAWLPTVAAL